MRVFTRSISAAIGLFVLSVFGPLGVASAMPTPVSLMPVVAAGYRLVRHFPAVSGLTGWVARAPTGEDSVLFTTPDGKTVIAGILSNEQGQNLTRQYAELYERAPNIDRLWPQIRSAYTVTEGPHTPDPRHQIWVVMDPNCAYCHQLWIELRPYEKAGLEVHWIPIGILFHSSTARAAAVLAGGAKTLYKMESRFDVARERGGVPGIKLTPELRQELAVNLSLAMQAGIQGTPGVFYLGSGGKLRLQQGLPAPSLLPRITGIKLKP
ncbi:MAG: thiol:disulfide interchange protein DsbG [Steroidobacteraceae bacterium]